MLGDRQALSFLQNKEASLASRAAPWIVSEDTRVEWDSGRRGVNPEATSGDPVTALHNHKSQSRTVSLRTGINDFLGVAWERPKTYSKLEVEDAPTSQSPGGWIPSADWIHTGSQSQAHSVNARRAGLRVGGYRSLRTRAPKSRVRVERQTELGEGGGRPRGQEHRKKKTGWESPLALGQKLAPSSLLSTLLSRKLHPCVDEELSGARGGRRVTTEPGLVAMSTGPKKEILCSIHLPLALFPEALPVLT